MHHTTSVHHTSYAHTLTSSAATTSDAPMSINDAAAKKCRFMMIVCWLMFIDVSSKIFYETANYPALERVIGEWITCLIEIGFSLWTIMGSKHERVAFHRNQSSLRFNFPNPEAWGLNAWPTLCQGVATNLSDPTVPDFNCPLVLKFLLFTTERGTRVRKVRPQQKSKYL